MALFRIQFEILTHFRCLICRRIVYAEASHVITDLVPRLSCTVCDRKLEGAWKEAKYYNYTGFNG